jgi:hypothetical protein
MTNPLRNFLAFIIVVSIILFLVIFLPWTGDYSFTEDKNSPKTNLTKDGNNILIAASVMAVVGLLGLIAILSRPSPKKP